MKNSHYTCEFFSNMILIMNSSRIDFYSRKKNGKIDIDWHGDKNGGEEVLDQAFQVLRKIDNLLIVAKSDPSTSATCFRLIYQIVREAKLLGVETRVVLPKKELFEAAEITGFSVFYRVFLSEASALKDLNITDFYPLAHISSKNVDPDPVVA